MSRPVTVAAIQLNSTPDCRANMERAEWMVRSAARQGAQLVALPELFCCLGDFPSILATAEPIPGPITERLARLSQELGIVLCGGSICEQADDDKVYNTSLLFGLDGRVLGKYRKKHLFEIDYPGKVQMCEADFFTAGSEHLVIDCGFAKIGIATCFDIRFPELFGELATAGAELIITPSAFTKATGRDHWEVLLRARAIENQRFVIAPNQVGTHAANLISFGHSVIVDPWGNVVSHAGGEEEEVILANIDLDEIAKIQARMPAIRKRRHAKP